MLRQHQSLSLYCGMDCEYIVSLHQLWDVCVCCLQMDFQVQYILWVTMISLYVIMLCEPKCVLQFLRMTLQRYLGHVTSE